ncbi:MAG: hypothetical protein WC634_00815 [archaeon]
MNKYFLIFLFCLLVFASGCIQSQQPVGQNRIEKYGFSLAPPQSAVWFDWKNIPFGETLFQAMTEDMEGEPMLILLKPEAGDGNGMSVIAVMLADNNSGYNDVSQIPQEMLQAGGGITGFGSIQASQANRIGSLNWILMEVDPTDENKAPFISDIAITICGKKVAALILMNGLQGLEENRAYFAKLAESGQCNSP